MIVDGVVLVIAGALENFLDNLERRWSSEGRGAWMLARRWLRRAEDPGRARALPRRSS